MEAVLVLTQVSIVMAHVERTLCRMDGGLTVGGAAGCRRSYFGRGVFFFFTLVTAPRRSWSLKLSDRRVYELTLE